MLGKIAGVSRHEAHLDFLDLRLETTDIRITLRWRLVKFHHVDCWIDIISKYTNDRVALVIHQDRTTGFQQVLVDKRHDRNITLPSTCSRNDSVIVVNDLLKRTDSHRGPSELVDLGSVLGRSIVTRSLSLQVLRLVGDEF